MHLHETNFNFCFRTRFYFFLIKIEIPFWQRKLSRFNCTNNYCENSLTHLMKTLNKNNENRILGPIKMNCLRQERKNECDDEHRRTSTEGKKNQSMWKNLFMKIRFFCFHIHENLSGNPHKCTLRLIFRSFEKALMTSLWREKYCLTLVFTRELLKLIVSIKKENCVEDLLNSHCVRRTLLPFLASSVGRNKTEPKRVRGMIPQSHHGAIFGEHITYE